MDLYDYEVNENGVYSQENAEKNGKKKGGSGKALIIVLAAVLSVLVIASGAFLVHEIISGGKNGTRSGSDSDAISRVTLVENDHGSDSNATNANESDGKGASDALYTDSSEIRKTDTKAKTFVIDVTEVVENVMPSVVSIVDELEITQTYNPFNFFFDGDSSSQISNASGSGVIIGVKDEELLIVTNNHVVSNEGSSSFSVTHSNGLTVTFSDGESAEATIRGTDSNTDLAVVTVKLADLSDATKDSIRIAVLGSSDDAKIGSGVIVIGNAGGYGQSVTSGIISAKDREVTIDKVTRKLIQTDAAINPGNSGGGMFNAAGELIGINCAKTVSTDIEGMCFAIPITSVKTIIENLMNREPVAEGEEGYLGIQGENVPDDFVEDYGYPAGVSISNIMDGSPVVDAGLQIRDIITSVNGQKVSSMQELKSVINSYPAGTTVTLTISRAERRGFKEFTAEVTLVKESDLETKK